MAAQAALAPTAIPNGRREGFCVRFVSGMRQRHFSIEGHTQRAQQGIVDSILGHNFEPVRN